MENLSNEKCIIKYDAERKEITGRDKTDIINEPAFYTTKKRNIGKAWEILKKTFTEKTTMQDAENVLWDCKLSPNTYCAN